VLRDAQLEDAAFQISLQRGAAVEPLPPPVSGEQKIIGRDRQFSLRNSDELDNPLLETWGNTLWDGYVSFSLTGDTGYGNESAAELVDASGTHYSLGDIRTLQKSFTRLPVPVRLVQTTRCDNRYSNCRSSSIRMAQVEFDVVRTKPTVASGLAGRFEGAETSKLLTSLGQDIPGNRITFTASARLFRNFTNGTGCTSFMIGNEKVDSPTPRMFSVTAPVTVTLDRSCVGARIASPESTTSDAQLSVSAIQIGALQ
jgi:hypothetical protein